MIAKIKEVVMPKDVLIRDIDEETLIKLKKKAAANNRSLQAELKSLLKSLAGPDIEEVRAIVRETLAKYRAEGRMFSDSTKDIREDRAATVKGFVIDATIAIKWLFLEKGSEQSEKLLEKFSFFFVPDLFLIELDAVITKKVRERKIDVSEAPLKIQQVRKLPYKVIRLTSPGCPVSWQHH